MIYTEFKEKAKDGRKKYIWGTKMWGIVLAIFCENYQIELCGFCDNDVSRWGQVIYGNKKCFPTSELDENAHVFIAIENEDKRNYVARQLQEKGIFYTTDLNEILHEYVKEIDDEAFIKAMWFCKMGYELDLNHPKTFNEKLQWLKIHDRKPLYTTLVDKYAVKKYVANIIGKEYIIPTIGVWNKFEDIDFNKLPNKFVLKCTHDSGGIVICKDKSQLNVEKAMQKMKASLQRNYYWLWREWPYKNVKPQIIAEEYLENNEEGLHDYKIWCFNGKPVYIQYITGRIDEQTYEGFYNTEWELQNFSYHNPRMNKPVSKPACLEELLNLSSQLSKGHPFLRCDFYILEDGSIRFGEITFYPMAGLESWKPCEMDKIMGDKIDIQRKEV